MMKIITALFVLCFFTAVAARAQQAHFVTSGTVTYEKRVNMYAVIKNAIDEKDVFDKQALDDYKNNNPRFKKLKSTLVFGGNKSLFTPAVAEETNGGWVRFAEQVNTTYTDIAAGTNVIYKDVFGEEFLVKDSVQKIKWKITDELREVAGYTCRRANGIIMDSIYVVAFYTNKIPVFGGPESFTGLPGMILQVAIPHENISWVATSVVDTAVPPERITPPKKGKPMDRKQLYDALKSAMKGWGKYGKQEIKLFLL